MATKVPEGYGTITPYLIIKNAEAFIDFSQKVFNATLLMKHLRDEKTIMHAEVKIGTSIIMFAESTDAHRSEPGSFFIYVDDADATYQLALQNGASSLAKPADQSYGRSGGVKDACGNTWWITSMA